MSKLRALAFGCFMVSVAALSSVNTQAKSEIFCWEQEECNDWDTCGGPCACTCTGWQPWPVGCIGGSLSDGYCAIPYSTE